MARRRLIWDRPLRTCRWLNECYICRKQITSGQQYYDGGYGRRAHRECGDKKHKEYLDMVHNRK